MKCQTKVCLQIHTEKGLLKTLN